MASCQKDTGLQMVEIRKITTYEDFARLRSAWNELAATTPVDHVFMRHEWFDCWIRSRPVMPDIAILCAWEGGQLVGIAPLQRFRRRMKGLPVKCIGYLHSSLSPRGNFMAADSAIVKDLLEATLTLPEIDLLLLDRMDCAVRTTGDIIGGLESGSETHLVSPADPAPYLAISGTWDDYLAGQSKKRRQFIRTECYNRLKKTDQHSFESIKSPDDFDRVFEIMLDISSRSWKADEGSAIGQVKPTHEFYRLYTPIGLAGGSVRIWLMMVNNRYVGFDYVLTHGTRGSLIRTDYDKEYGYYHPGENLKLRILQSEFQKSVDAEFDFGAVASAYKMKWSSDVRRQCNVAAATGSMVGRLFIWWRKRQAAGENASQERACQS